MEYDPNPWLLYKGAHTHTEWQTHVHSHMHTHTRSLTSTDISASEIAIHFTETKSQQMYFSPPLSLNKISEAALILT